ncbi:MAG TPA: ATP-binding protein [Candidatus Polarisedimenticolia bacterium]|nr:ATP-binding protein [Candidatus Polarisedimenticolia bacterium]
MDCQSLRKIAGVGCARIRVAVYCGHDSISRFDFAFNVSINRQQVFDLATCRFVERHEAVLIRGPTGVDKSHLAQALGHEACRRGFDVLFTTASRMLAHLNGGRADGTYEKRLAGYVRPDLLILDDFGLKALPAPGPDDLYEVIHVAPRRICQQRACRASASNWG